MNKYTMGILLLICSSLCANVPHHQEMIAQNEISFINYLFTDLNGCPKEVMYPAFVVDDLEENGFNFDGSSVPGMTRITESDMLAMPDMSTLSVVPWSHEHNPTARVICDIYQDEHTPYAGDPRYILKQAIEQASEMGFDFFVGPELEFYICKNDEFKDANIEPCDTQAYFDDAKNKSMVSFKTKLFAALHAQNVMIEKIHHEVGPGQYEMSFKYNNALKIADQLIIAKQTIRALCQQCNLKATFMPKPFFGQNGSGMHIHFSLWNRNKNCNAFYDEEDSAKLSPTAKQFIAGVLAHITDLNALFNPTVNSYKRLVPGFEAPINICWGTKNRSALVRIPRVNDDQPNAVRAELRSGDPMANPYLAFAALLHAGLDGIKNQLSLAAPIEDNLYHLTHEERRAREIRSVPSSLENALILLQQSSFAKNVLGDCLLAEFVKNKQEEIAQYNTFITDWEIQTYFHG